MAHKKDIKAAKKFLKKHGHAKKGKKGGKGKKGHAKRHHKHKYRPLLGKTKF